MTINHYQNIQLSDIKLSVRAKKVLRRKKLHTIADVMQYGINNLINLPNVGKKTLKEITEAVKGFTAAEHTSKELFFAGPDGQDVSSFPVQLLLYMDTQKENNPGKIGRLPKEQTLRHLINAEIEDDILAADIKELNLSTRAYNVLNKVKVKTVADILAYNLIDLLKSKNVGKLTIQNIIKSIEHYIKSTDAGTEVNFSEAIEDIFTIIPSNYLPIIKARFGYDTGRMRTLDDIGKEYKITRERVRQIIAKEKEMQLYRRKSVSLQKIVENVERLLLKRKGIINRQDLKDDYYFMSGSNNQLTFIINYLDSMYEDHYRIIDKIFLTNLSEAHLEKTNKSISKSAEHVSLPINENEFYKTINSALGGISKYYLRHFLMQTERMRVEKKQVILLGRQTLSQRVAIILRDATRPLHYREVTEIYKKKYLHTQYQNIEHYVHARLLDSGDIALVGPGTFTLKEKIGCHCDQSALVKTSKEILEKLSGISDTKYLIGELKKRGVVIDDLNEYSLKDILLGHPGFANYRKFEIGLADNATERQNIKEIIYRILVDAKKPMKAKAIWSELAKKRGIPEYMVYQHLYKEPEFIKTHEGTWTVKENVENYEKIKKVVIDFAKEWIGIKKSVISAFVIAEAIRASEKIKEISLGLVVNILSAQSEFVQVANGYYNLVSEANLRQASKCS